MTKSCKRARHHHSRKKYRATFRDTWGHLGTLGDTWGHMSPFNAKTRGSRSRETKDPEARNGRFTHSQIMGPTAGKARTDLTGLDKRNSCLQWEIVQERKTQTHNHVHHKNHADSGSDNSQLNQKGTYEKPFVPLRAPSCPFVDSTDVAGSTSQCAQHQDYTTQT